MLVVIFVFRLAAQEKLVPGSFIPVMSWGGISESQISVDNYKKLREAGVNIDIAFFRSADSVAHALDCAQKAGVKLMISCDGLKSNPEKIAARFKSHPALEGYYLADEPGRADFDELAQLNNRLGKADNSHYSFVNLYPDINSNRSKFGTKSYREYVDIFDSLFAAPYLSFDFYPVVDGGIHPRWYENLEFFSSRYASSGRPFRAFTLTTSYLAYSNDSPQPTLEDFYQLYKTYHPEKTFVHDIPSLEGLRLQTFVNLAYGAQGIELWSFRGFGSPLDKYGKRTVVFERVQKVLDEIQRYAPVFLGSKVVSVAHTGQEIPNGTIRFSNLPPHFEMLETSGDGAVVSLLKKGSTLFLVVVNRDLANPIKLITYTDGSVKRIMLNGTLIPAGEFTNSTEIDPGDWVIYTMPE